MAIPLPEFLSRDFGNVTFAISPYLSFGGITIMYGKTRIGKSPLTWEMARCVATGEPFFGLPTTKGPVLYIDLDTAPQLVQKRLKLIDVPPENFFVEFPGVRNIFHPTTQEYFRSLKEKVMPIFVIINTLRKLYSGDEKDASVPSRIYSQLSTIFRPAAILLVHHDKKTQPQTLRGDPDEEFSGHMAWLNDCQTGLHLVQWGNQYQKGLLRLIHTKSQVSEQVAPLLLQLDKNGTHIVSYKGEIAAKIIKLFHSLPDDLNKTDKVNIIAKKLLYSPRMVWTYLSWLNDSTSGTSEEIN